MKKAEHQRIDAFDLWCYRRLLKVPCTARRSEQSILREINTEYSLEGLTLKLKLQYFVQPVAKSQLIGEDPDAGKGWGQEKKEPQKMDAMVRWHHQLNGHEFKQTPGDNKGQESLECYSSWRRKESDKA